MSPPKPRWVCEDCQIVVELNRHGYCFHCGGNAVTLIREAITNEQEQENIDTPTKSRLA